MPIFDTSINLRIPLNAGGCKRAYMWTRQLSAANLDFLWDFRYKRIHSKQYPEAIQEALHVKNIVTRSPIYILAEANTYLRPQVDLCIRPFMSNFERYA